jgi:hypothetical protein
VEELSQETRDGLFHPDKKKREKMREKLSRYINNVLNVSYGADLFFVHNCPSVPEQSDRYIPITDKDCLLREKKLDIFRECRHEDASLEHDGNIIQCELCSMDFSPNDLIKMSLDYHQGFSPVRIHIIQFYLKHILCL